LRTTFWLALLLLGCSGSDGKGAPPGASRPVDTPEPATAVYVGLEMESDSALPVARAREGRRSIRVDGRVLSLCKRHAPLVQYSDVVTGRVVLDVSLSIPVLCLPKREIYTYTAIVQDLPPGRYPLEVQLRIHSRDPGIRSSRRVVLQDTLIVAD
jgi:hypothetical protein